VKIVIPGGSGQVGTVLSRALGAEGHDVVVLSRRPPAAAAPWRTVTWDGETLGPWTAELEGADVVVNLAGGSVNCRYGDANRRRIMDSRILSTRVLGAAMAAAARPPRIWLQASTATIYAHRYDAANGESTGILGGAEVDLPDTWRFSIEVATAWERAARTTVLPRTRLVLMRTAIVMAPTAGGAFDILLRLVRFGLGGRQGDGRQFVSWIHDRDLVRAVHWLVEHEELSGPVNLAAPAPLPNEEFMGELRQAWGTRVALPASEALLTVGALAIRTETELVLKSRRVVPERLLDSGFVFDYPDWPAAAGDLCRRWREGKER
jgi:uncharacterized protein